MPKQKNQQMIKHLKYFSKILGGIVFLVGLAGIVGWQFDILFLKRILPSFPIIAPNTALSFFLGGIVLFLVANSKTEEKKYLKIILYIFSSFIALAGFFTLLEYLFEVNFGIDCFLFAAAQGETAVRMSPQSAFNFSMVGISFLFILGQKNEKIKIG